MSCYGMVSMLQNNTYNCTMTTMYLLTSILYRRAEWDRKKTCKPRNAGYYFCREVLHVLNIPFTVKLNEDVGGGPVIALTSDEYAYIIICSRYTYTDYIIIIYIHIIIRRKRTRRAPSEMLIETPPRWSVRRALSCDSLVSRYYDRS